MNGHTQGWFVELGTLWPGQAMSLEVEKVLVDEHSKYQHVQVFESKTYGKVLVLDGVIQVTERDEFSYQEMIVNLPVFSHPNPKKVLVVGAGDGGAVRELAKIPSIESITMCEIDEKVIEVCKQHLPALACGFDSPKVNVIIGDGCAYMENHKNEFDIIITDSSDPVGPAETLFQENYYRLMGEALNETGLLCTQGMFFYLCTCVIYFLCFCLGLGLGLCLEFFVVMV